MATLLAVLTSLTFSSAKTADLAMLKMANNVGHSEITNNVNRFETVNSVSHAKIADTNFKIVTLLTTPT
jgi:hypothetical protein